MFSLLSNSPANDCRVSGEAFACTAAMDGPPAPPVSRTRSLLGDLAHLLDCQMKYWGMDARGGERSVMVATGLAKQTGNKTRGEGSSRYREQWQGGFIELHSYCVGYYHKSLPGILFSRAEGRVYAAEPGEVPVPGLHRNHFLAVAPDSIFPALPPFLSWLLDYERRVGIHTPAGYRENCWRSLGGHRFALRPTDMHLWLASLLRDPRTTPRLRSRKHKAVPAMNLRNESRSHTKSEVALQGSSASGIV